MEVNLKEWGRDLITHSKIAFHISVAARRGICLVGQKMVGTRQNNAIFGNFWRTGWLTIEREQKKSPTEHNMLSWLCISDLFPESHSSEFKKLSFGNSVFSFQPWKIKMNISMIYSRCAGNPEYVIQSCKGLNLSPLLLMLWETSDSPNTTILRHLFYCYSNIFNKNLLFL